MKKESVGVYRRRLESLADYSLARSRASHHEEGDTAPLEWARDKLAMETELALRLEPEEDSLRMAGGDNSQVFRDRVRSPPPLGGVSR